MSNSKPREFWIQYYSSIESYVTEEKDIARHDWKHFREVTPEDAKLLEFKMCFDSALGEGFKELIDQSDDERLKDIFYRRIMFGYDEISKAE